MRTDPLILFTVLLTLSATGRSVALADDWPFFRGPNYDGYSAETGWNPRWGAEGPKIAWKKNVGVGASSFVVVEGKAITMGNTRSTNQDVVSCLDPETGDTIWTFRYPAKYESRLFEGGTSATPTIDGAYVYTLAYDGQVYCLRLDDGHVAWSRHLVRDFGGRYSRWKYAGSPLVYGPLLIFDAGGYGNSTLALDKRTGRRVWGAGIDSAGYATPVPFRQGNLDAVMVFKGQALVAHDMRTGRLLWRIPWLTSYDVNASTPIILGRTFFASSGYPTGRGMLFRLTTGIPRILWRNNELKTKTSSCVVIGRYVYGVSERGGNLLCIDLQNGRTVWRQRGFGSGTLAGADRKLIVLGSRGNLAIAEASPQGYKPISRAQILGRRSWVTPVLARGRLYCKNNMGAVVCLDLRPQSEPNPPSPEKQRSKNAPDDVSMNIGQTRAPSLKLEGPSLVVHTR